VAPFPGALTVTPFAELAVVDAAVVAAVVLTVTGTSVTHTAPPFPHAFTCSACEPVVAVTVALMEVPLAIVVLLLLSSENPIEETV
jgi:hypothetical protein